MFRRVIMLAAMLGCAAIPSNGDVDLKVLSFNVRFGTASDGANAWEHRHPILIEALKELDADVIGVQECLEFQAEYIVEQLPAYRWFGVAREEDGSGEHAAVFYKKDVLAPIATGNFWLSESPDAPGTKSWDSDCTRMATWARFRHVKSGAFFHFFNTHFDHRGQVARREAANILVQRAADVAGDGPVIITGDFNAAAGSSEPWKLLVDAGFRDAWTSAEKREGPTVTYQGFKPPKEGVDSRIDWVMMAGPVKSTFCETVTFARDGRYPSDHFPVLAKVVIDR